MIVWPAAIVDELASNTTRSFRPGKVGENVKFAPGLSDVLPTPIVVPPDVVDWPISSVTVNCMM